MLKNPIPKVTNQLQHRAIGIINGKFTPLSREQLNRGFLIDKKGEKIETVVLGKALSLLKKHIDLKKNYYWIVYPCLLYTSPSPRDSCASRMPSSA